MYERTTKAIEGLFKGFEQLTDGTWNVWVDYDQNRDRIEVRLSQGARYAKVVERRDMSRLYMR